MLAVKGRLPRPPPVFVNESPMVCGLGTDGWLEMVTVDSCRRNGGKVTGERLALDNQGKRVAGCEGMIIACVSTNMSTVRSHDGHMMGT